MSSRQRRDSSGEPYRPPVAGAPEWFNRARATANQRQVFHPRPIPVAQFPPVPGAPVKRLRPFRDVRWILVLSLAAVPLVFCAGYLTRGLPGSPKHAPASGHLEAAVSGARVENHQAASEATGRADVPVGSTRAAGVIKANDGRLADQNLPALVAITPAIVHRQSPPAEIGAAPASTEAPPASPARTTETADGFSLKTPGPVRQITAEVVQPVNAWFDATAKEADCTTGMCAAPVRNVVDRKLNTALDWSPTPDAAAAAAEREGKLVFLIHVSGNFAQPGFT